MHLSRMEQPKALLSSPGLGQGLQQAPQLGLLGWAGGALSRKAVPSDRHAPPNPVSKPDAEATCMNARRNLEGSVQSSTPVPVC